MVQHRVLIFQIASESSGPRSPLYARVVTTIIQRQRSWQQRRHQKITALTTKYEDLNGVDSRKCCAFLLSKTLNTLNSSFIACMDAYKSTTNPLAEWRQQQIHSPSTNAGRPLVPHIKSFGRILAQKKNNNNNKHALFACFMLTSACLSCGVQGQPEHNDNVDVKDARTAYSNFELGVLFCSRLRGNPAAVRVAGTASRHNCFCGPDVVPVSTCCKKVVIFAFLT